jgi:hypothetical protein
MRKPLTGVSARMSADFRVNAVPAISEGKSIPAPVGGLNTVSPLQAMPETDAITLDNVFPQPGYLEIRRGHKRHNLVGAAAVESLLVYHAPTTASDAMFACCTSVISNVSVYTSASASATASIALSSLTNARWQQINFSNSGGNYLWICNGADAPRTFDGTNWATASVTGVTAVNIANVALHKQRIWVCLNGSLNPAYLNTGAIAGTATPFDLQGVFKKGGFLQAIGSWSLDGGAGPDDYIAFITSKGEVAIYAGLDPAANFAIKGVFEIGPPLGRRCLVKVGADLLLACQDGLVPLSKALVTDRAAAISAAITAKIQPTVNGYARSYGGNFGWEICVYPRGTRAILNIPVTENTLQYQFVMNTVTGAWARFTGENANCWAVFQDRLFYGGNNGLVYEADAQGFDPSASIDIDIETAFNYQGSKGRQKQWTMGRSILTTDGQVVPGLALNVDFGRDATVYVPSGSQTVAAQWDVDNWDAGTWPVVNRVVTDWQAVEGIGYCVSVRTQAQVQAATTAGEAQTLTLQMHGWDLLHIKGAFM